MTTPKRPYKRTKKITRLVKVDLKTYIEVGPEKTDEEAVEEFLEKLDFNKKRLSAKYKGYEDNDR